jgi:hypothetical protein
VGPFDDPAEVLKVTFVGDFGKVDAPSLFRFPQELKTIVPFLEGALPQSVQINVSGARPAHADEHAAFRFPIIESFPFVVLPPVRPSPGSEPGAVFD